MALSSGEVQSCYFIVPEEHSDFLIRASVVASTFTAFHILIKDAVLESDRLVLNDLFRLAYHLKNVLEPRTNTNPAHEQVF